MNPPSTLTMGSPIRGFLLLLALVSALTCGEEREASPPDRESHAHGASVPSGFIDEIVVSGLRGPTQMAFAPDGRLFVLEQTGTVRVIKGNTLNAAPFLSLATDASGERGLLGIAFDPNFASNQFVYLYYTTTSGGTHNRLSRFTANGDVAVPGSEVVLADYERLSSATNHNGGAVQIGGDGKLYVAVGDNADGANAESLGTRLGKMHRYNLDGSIPGDNPFASRTTGANRSIWALGLRNPYSFAVQPGSGKIFINDVGQSDWEEIDLGAPGANYGWPHAEGPLRNVGGDTPPVYAYDHGSGCSIVGGAFYNPPQSQYPAAWTGHYFFADFCGGWIRRLDPSTKQAFDFARGIDAPIDLRVGPDGAIYYLGRSFNGVVGRIRVASNQPPRIDVQPANQSVAAGRSATFSVAASGTPPLSYQWQRGGANLAGANGPSYTLATTSAADSGAQFRVIVSSPYGSATSNSATLTVINNQVPVATITAPGAGSLYSAGQTISYAGTGRDPEDGDLPASAFTWEVVFHHEGHTHIFLEPFSGVRSGSFVIPNRGETATNVWYRVHLSVRDSAGIVTRTSADIRPRLANIGLASSPPGLQVSLDGQPFTTPASVTSVVGMIRTLGAASPQSAGGKTYVFASWSDGGSTSHNITAPPTDQTYSASFNDSTPSASGGGLLGEYFDNIDLTAPKLTRTDGVVDFNWTDRAPDPSVGVDTFSVRWTGTVTPAFSELYRFTTIADDGIRLWVNGQLLIDNWADQGATERSGFINLSAGQAYSIKVEYYENGGLAEARLLWSSSSTPRQAIPQSRLSPGASPVPQQPPPPPPPPPPGGGGLTGDYFEGAFATLRFTRTDPVVDFDWAAGAPDPRLPSDGYTVRWTGTVTPAASETYTFYTRADDGIRLWLNNQLIIDNWVDQPVTERAGSLTLVAGQPYAIRVEYYESGGLAEARLLWSSASTPKQVIPQARLAPAR